MDYKDLNDIRKTDVDVYNAIIEESIRQEEHIELIASENYVSKAVLEATGSILTNKYAEGYPGKRYYGGCENVDVVENLAKQRIKKLFSCKFANVQPHSGSQANMAVYKALLKPGDRILGMALDAGGHLTHGYKLSFSGQDYESYQYGVDPKSETIDYDEVERIALSVRPNLIMAGASAYPRFIDFKRFKEIADKVGAYLVVDAAHIAGLIVAGVHPSPFPYADVVTSTTHKTLRGPRGGIILTNNEEIAEKLDKSIFPGIQGGPLMHVIAAKAIAFKEDLDPSFVTYAKQIVANCKVMGEEFKTLGYRLVTNGTDNHLILIDIKSKYGISGKEAETLLHSVNITCNKNSIPNDKEKPSLTSGIRLGTPAITTRGMKEKEMKLIVSFIDRALKNRNNEDELAKIKQEVISLTKLFPLYQ